jgi:hypothetical protein
MGPRVAAYGRGKSHPPPGFDPGTSSPQRVAVPSTLSRRTNYLMNREKSVSVLTRIVMVFLSESCQSDRMTQSVWKRKEREVLSKRVTIFDYFAFLTSLYTLMYRTWEAYIFWLNFRPLPTKWPTKSSAISKHFLKAQTVISGTSPAASEFSFSGLLRAVSSPRLIQKHECREVSEYQRPPNLEILSMEVDG